MKMYKVISLHVRDSEGNRTEVSKQSVREFGVLRFRVHHAKVRRQVQCTQTSYLQQGSFITDILKTKHEKIGINSPFLEKYLITEQPVFRFFLRRFHFGASIRSDLHLKKKVFFPSEDSHSFRVSLRTRIAKHHGPYIYLLKDRVMTAWCAHLALLRQVSRVVSHDF